MRRAASDAAETSSRLRFLGDAVLMRTQPSVPPADVTGPVFQEQLRWLRRAMAEHGGIGIAAPQVGWEARVFCLGIEGGSARYPAAGNIPFAFWINPEIVWRSEATSFMWEGCLSVPKMRGWVERPVAVVMRGWDEDGEKCERRLEGLEARVAQHEMDHLDGILFPMCVAGTEFLVPQASMDAQEGWGEDWPSPGSRKTGLGALSNER